MKWHFWFVEKQLISMKSIDTLMSHWLSFNRRAPQSHASTYSGTNINILSGKYSGNSNTVKYQAQPQLFLKC